MTTTTTPSRVEGGDAVPLRAPTIGWALRQTLLCILILVFSIGGVACLLYASIDPEESGPPAAASSGRPSSPASSQPAPPNPPRQG